MEGNDDDGLEDLFPQAGPQNPPCGINFFSKFESSFAPRHGLENLDLNFQAEEFLDLSTYSDFLRGDGVPRGRASRTLGIRAARNAGPNAGGFKRVGGSKGTGGSRLTCSKKGLSGSRGPSGSKGAGSSQGAGGSRGADGSKGPASRGGVGCARSFGAGGSSSAGRGGGRPGGACGGGNPGRPEDVFDVDEQNIVEDAAMEVVFPGSKV